MIERVFHAFSIVARCPRTGSFGVAVSTARPAVGAAVPWVSARGAVATQAKTNTELGRRALALLDQDVGVGVALDALLDAIPSGTAARSMASPRTACSPTRGKNA